MVTQMNIKNFWKEENYMLLQDYEEVCPDCKGHGITAALWAEDLLEKIDNIKVDGKELLEKIDNIKVDGEEAFDSPNMVALVFCNRCGGEGKVDWIRKIRGSEIF